MKPFKIILLTVAINAIIAFILFSFLENRKASQKQVTKQNVYDFQEGVTTRWISFENPEGEKGKGGQENEGWKGHPYDHIKPGEKKVIFDVEGSGVIHRIWMTGNIFRIPETRKMLRIDIYWDNQEKPAVSAPVSAFFGGIMGTMLPFETAGTSSPEGRSFCSIFQMPFKERAKITITNESDEIYSYLFFDINYSLGIKHTEQMLYFHCFWNREKPPVGTDYTILPRVNGKGRLFGAFIGVKEDDYYQRQWWGEGEVKMYLDGDRDLPTLVGTGAEDYPGTGFGLRTYNNRYQGATVADPEKGEWIFYRFHVPDPIWFHQNLRMTIQQMGGAMKETIVKMMEALPAGRQEGKDLELVTLNTPYTVRKFKEEEKIPDLKSDDIPNDWINFLRSDTWTSVAYFYLDKPASNLRTLPDYKERIKAFE